MSSIPWIMISIAILLVIGLIVFIFAVRKQKKRPTDYYNLFIIGIIWVGAGIAMGIVPLWTVGLILMAIGLSNKKKWKKNRVRWEDLTPGERKFKIWIIVILGVLLLVGLVTFIYLNSIVTPVSNFEECIAVGNPAMESYPRQCIHGDKTFIEQIEDTILTDGS
jgi:hypothetical protein